MMNILVSKKIIPVGKNSPILIKYTYSDSRLAEKMYYRLIRKSSDDVSRSTTDKFFLKENGIVRLTHTLLPNKIVTIVKRELPLKLNRFKNMDVEWLYTHINNIIVVKEQ